MIGRATHLRRSGNQTLCGIVSSGALMTDDPGAEVNCINCRKILRAGGPAYSNALAGAVLRGMRAALAGEPITACPYRDVRKWNGKLTWSRAFESAWRDGWEKASRVE